MKQNSYKFECKVSYPDTENVWLAQTLAEAISQVECQLEDPDSIMGFVTEVDSKRIPVHTTCIERRR
jgi:hypothetical protein